MENLTEPKFHPGDRLTHRKGGTYLVLFTPPLCFLEADRSPAYIYMVLSSSKIHVRCQSEMEDGRFWRV